VILDVLQHVVTFHSLTHIVLADDGSGDDTGESKKAGPIGIVIIILLCIGCYFLFKSMSKHLRRVRENFPEELPPDPLHPMPRAVVKPAVSLMKESADDLEKPADAASG
jgi:hypothetical protein